MYKVLHPLAIEEHADLSVLIISIPIYPPLGDVSSTSVRQARDDVIAAQRQELQLQSAQLVQLQHQLASCQASPGTFLRTLGEGEAAAETE